MRFLSTQAHGVLDYATVALLLALPFMLAETPQTAMLLQGTAALILLASLMTRYELGPFKVIPMSVHLMLDCLIGVAILVYAWGFSNDPMSVRYVLTALGLFALFSSFCTRLTSTVEDNQRVAHP